MTQDFGNNSLAICPYGAMTGKNEWRDLLKKDDIIDCLDTIDNWYLSTILDTRISKIYYGKEIKEVLVGFRNYSDLGIRNDDKGKYTGWSSSYDEWINNYSLRIQKYNYEGHIVCQRQEPLCVGKLLMKKFASMIKMIFYLTFIKLEPSRNYFCFKAKKNAMQIFY